MLPLTPGLLVALACTLLWCCGSAEQQRILHCLHHWWDLTLVPSGLKQGYPVLVCALTSCVACLPHVALQVDVQG